MNSVFEVFQATAARRPDAPFLCVPARAQRDYCPEGAEFSYQWMLDQALAAAHAYTEAGYGHGHRIALLLENRPEFFVQYLALNSLGVAIVPVNPDYRHDEIVYQLDHADVVLAVGISNRVTDLERASENCPLRPPAIDIARLGDEALPRADQPPPRATAAIGRETECAMLYTSGTTGRPKGCLLTNDYFITAGEWYLALGGEAALVGDTDRVLNPLPLYHMNSLAVTATGLMCGGGCLISPDRFHPKSWWEDVITTQATVIHYLGVVPPLLMNLPTSEAESNHSVRFGIGAGIDPDHHTASETRFGFPMVEVWGMTETGRIFADNHPPRQVGTRAFGKPMAGLEARVVDDHDQDVAVGTPGELLVRHTADDPRRGFFSAYHKNEQATAEAWRGDWFHTGDTVRQDEDGMLYFIDRNKNIIRRSGENIAAGEIEAALQAHSAVAQAAVIGVPDDLREEEVFACIVVMPDTNPNEATARALFDWCMARLAYYKAPGYVLFRESLPTTGTQKVQKTLIFPPETDPRAEPGCIDLRRAKRRGG